jgi:hypothetical protein
VKEKDLAAREILILATLRSAWLEAMIANPADPRARGFQTGALRHLLEVWKSIGAKTAVGVAAVYTREEQDEIKAQAESGDYDAFLAPSIRPGGNVEE